MAALFGDNTTPAFKKDAGGVQSGPSQQGAAAALGALFAPKKKQDQHAKHRKNSKSSAFAEPSKSSDLSASKARRRMTWMNIANCVDHEMYTKLGSVLRAIVDEHDKHEQEINAQSMDELMEILKRKRNLCVEERAYLRRLIERAINREDRR